jgi:epithelial splicing regulatory protein 1/2
MSAFPTDELAAAVAANFGMQIPFYANPAFASMAAPRGGVALCLNQQGRRNGDALVRFQSQDQRDMGLKRHKQQIGSRYVDVYRSSGDEYNVAGGEL